MFFEAVQRLVAEWVCENGHRQSAFFLGLRCPTCRLEPALREVPLERLKRKANIGQPIVGGHVYTLTEADVEWSADPFHYSNWPMNPWPFSVCGKDDDPGENRFSLMGTGPR